MPGQLKSVSFTSPYDAEAQELERRRALAQALYQQGQTPLGPTEHIGGWAIPRSPMEGVGKMAQQISGAYQMRQATDEKKALAERMRDERRISWAAALKAAEGTPATPMSVDVADNVTPAQPAVAGGGLKALAAALAQSNDPMLQQMGMQQQMAQFASPKYHVVDGNLVAEPQPGSAPGTQVQPSFTAPKFQGVQGVGPTGAPVTQFVNLRKPPESGIAHPMPGFLGQLQALGILQPGMEKDPRVQTLISGYLGKETGQITPEKAAELTIKLAHLQNEGIGLGLRRGELNFNTGSTGMGGGAAVPGAPQAFNLFGPPTGPQPTGAPQIQLGPVSAPTAPPNPERPAPRPAPQAAPSVPTIDPNKPIIDQVTPKERQELLVKRPQAEAAATTTMQNIERMGHMAKELSEHPGLENITGKVMQYGVLDMLPETRAARGLQGSLVKQVGVQALQAMRDASKTGGAVGQVTEKEWPIMQQSIAALDDAQSTEDYRKALSNLQAQIKSSSERIRRAYEQTYGPLKYHGVPYFDQSRTTTSGSIRSRADAILGLGEGLPRNK